MPKLSATKLKEKHLKDCTEQLVHAITRGVETTPEWQDLLARVDADEDQTLWDSHKQEAAELLTKHLASQKANAGGGDVADNAFGNHS